jgi:hypothetical protein
MSPIIYKTCGLSRSPRLSFEAYREFPGDEQEWVPESATERYVQTELLRVSEWLLNARKKKPVSNPVLKPGIGSLALQYLEHPRDFCIR